MKREPRGRTEKGRAPNRGRDGPQNNSDPTIRFGEATRATYHHQFEISGVAVCRGTMSSIISLRHKRGYIHSCRTSPNCRNLCRLVVACSRPLPVVHTCGPSPHRYYLLDRFQIG
jgi:hypothetical protein